MVYDEENHDANGSNRIPWFDKLIEGIDGRTNLFFIMEVDNTHSSKKEIYGFFTNMNNFEAKNFTMPTYSINIPHSKANFFFKYNEEEELHFHMKETNGAMYGGNFLTIYNDGPTVGGEFLTIDNFIHIFFTNSFQVEQVGGHYSLQCLEKEFDASVNKGP